MTENQQTYWGDEQLNEASQHEVEVRSANNELFDLTQKNEVTFDDLRRIDEVNAQKAQAVLEGYAEANPDALAAVQSMIATYASTDMVDNLLDILQDITDARTQAYDDPARYAELTDLVAIIEKMLVVHVAQVRSEQPFWMLGAKAK